MNKFKKNIFKKLSIIILCFLFSFNFSVPQKANALDNPFKLDLMSPDEVLYICLGMSALASGVVAKNRDDIKYLGQQIGSQLEALGKPVSEVVVGKTITWCAELKQAIANVVSTVPRGPVEIPATFTTVGGSPDVIPSWGIHYNFATPYQMHTGNFYYCRITSEPGSYHIGGSLGRAIQLSNTTGSALLTLNPSFVIPGDGAWVCSTDGSQVTFRFNGSENLIGSLYSYALSGTHYMYNIELSSNASTIIDLSDTIPDTVSDNVTALLNKMDEFIQNGANMTFDGAVDLTDATLEKLSDIARVDTSGITSTLTNVVDWVKAIPGAISSGVASVISAVVAIPGEISNTLDRVFDFTLPSEVALDFTPLAVPFQTKFPFSIPYDLAESFSALNVTPVAPHWEIVFPETSLTSSETIDINFDIFEPWAKIVRWGITIVFVVGLIMITRRLIG